MALHDGEGLTPTHLPSGTADTHTRFTPEQEERHRRMRKAASDGAQAKIWNTFLLLVALLVLGGLVWGLTRANPARGSRDASLPSLALVLHDARANGCNQLSRV
jgi:hypothetical protein